MAAKSTFDWNISLEDPIEFPGGKVARTLGEAAAFIEKLPESEHSHPKWQLAIAELMTAAQRQSPVMHARIAVLQAIHRDAPPRPATRAVRERPWMRSKRVERR